MEKNLISLLIVTIFEIASCCVVKVDVVVKVDGKLYKRQLSLNFLLSSGVCR